MKKIKIFHTLLSKVNNERGNLIIISYFAIISLLGIGAAFLLLTMQEARTSERQRLSTLAFYTAEAGLERGLYDLKKDFEAGGNSPSWKDGNINGYMIGPNTNSYYQIPYVWTTLNDGAYVVELKNVAGSDDIWLRSTGTVKDVSHTIDVYVRMVDVSPWGNAIFAGAGASGTMINGNVDIRGSVHILGDGLADGDFAVDIGGTAEFVGNNYRTLDQNLKDKVPALPTVVVGGETVETLNSELRVKKGKVGLSGNSTVGESNSSGNAYKETVDGIYVTDGWGGNQGASHAYSDNGTTNAYDLGDTVGFPLLSDPSSQDPTKTNYEYMYDNGLVLTNELVDIDPGDSFSYTDGTNTISMDGNGNLYVEGKIYVDGGNNLKFDAQGGTDTITYTGEGVILVTGNIVIETNLVTSGNNSFPNNIIGFMTPGNITVDASQLDLMGLFYTESQMVVEKQTDIMGTIVANYFDMGTNVPAIYQVPDTINHVPDGMIGKNSIYYTIVAWMKS